MRRGEQRLLLVVDAGNTDTVFGLYCGDELKANWRMATDRRRSSDEIGMTLTHFISSVGVAADIIDGIIISSVVPQIMHALNNAMKRYIGRDPLVVGVDVDAGLASLCGDLSELGTDRLVNAVCAREKYRGTAVIVVDFGTATTFCAISKEGYYMGGVIVPGIKISMDALVEHTAKLPRVEIVKPKRVISSSTIGSMQSGAVFGYVGQVDYIVKRMKEEMGDTNCKVIATGGLAHLIASEAQSVNVIDSFLTLNGLKLLYDKNKI